MKLWVLPAFRGTGRKSLETWSWDWKGVHRGKYLWGQDATHWSVARIRSSGVAFIPEDPLGMAAVAGLTVQENMALGNTRRYARQGGLSMDWESVRDDLEQSLKRSWASKSHPWINQWELSPEEISSA